MPSPLTPLPSDGRGGTEGEFEEQGEGGCAEDAPEDGTAYLASVKDGGEERAGEKNKEVG